MFREHPIQPFRPGMAGVLIAAVFALLAAGTGRTGRSAVGQSQHRPSASDRLEHEAASAKWERVNLRAALNRLAEPHGIHLFLDRRIDPDTPVTGEFPFQPLRGIYEEIGESHGFELTVLGSVVYLGPKEVTRRLRTVDQLRRFELRSVNQPFQEMLLAGDNLTWADLSTPRDLVERVCRNAQVSLNNAEIIPHDLWAAGKLPGVPRTTQLTILLAGFDLTFACSARGVLTLRPVRSDERWEQDYPLPRGGAAVLDEVRRQFPDALISVQPRRFHVTSLVEHHEAIQRWLRDGGPLIAESARPRTSAQLERRFSLRVVRKPLRDVLQAIERDTQFRIAVEDATSDLAGGALDQLVTFEVRDVDVDGLMKAVLEPVGLRHRRDGEEIQIFVPSRP